ncbi:hypothetical protein [Tepidibacillus sp. LV47]|uniref:hypothetical protein n=1 Tax=Tepidibacillus sp. LV47 TaxID=3398228 RepID=UPI003AAA22A3
MTTLWLYQYTCPRCSYTLYSEKDDEELYCKTKHCSFKDPLPAKKEIKAVVEDDFYYTVKETFMVDHGCCEVRPIKAGTRVEILKIKKGWYLCETEEGFNFYVPKEKLEQKKKRSE